MKIYKTSETAAGKLKSPAVAIGNFDGIHLGHKALFTRAMDLARERSGDAAVLTFSPHPARYFNPDLAPPLINTEERKLELMEEFGLDAVVVETFDADFAALDARAFAGQVLQRNLGAKHVVVGHGFSFGRKREGDLSALQRLGVEFGFLAHGIPAVRAESIVVSSTKIRNFLLLGRVSGAAALMGREYMVRGEVVQGRGRGRTIGIPTANVNSDSEILPQGGVYAGRLRLPGGEILDSVINIGTNPTFEKAAVMTLEVHVLDFDQDIYGQQVGVIFTRRLRAERRFSSVDELIEAIKGDIQVARQVLEPT